MVTSKEFLDVALSAVKMGVRIAKSDFNTDLDISYKARREVVTNADFAVEAKIKNFVLKKFCDHGFWGEEEEEVLNTSDYRWVLDPIDGTYLYTRGIPFWCISLALEYKGEAQIGVVYCPMLNQMFTAVKGKGSFCNDEKISVSNRGKKDVVYFLANNEFFRKDKFFKPYRAALDSHNLRMNSFGSTAFEMCQLAAGRADVVFSYHVKPGDIAAALLIVREAGGIVKTIDGKKANSSDSYVIATNKKLRGSIVV